MQYYPSSLMHREGDQLTSKKDSIKCSSAADC